jgi:DNA-binding GntR family transcriptional regulator
VPRSQEALPKYRQIANHIRDQILRGDLLPGDEVPSERSLALSHHVARPTATKALELLRAQGLVESRQGSGSYVRHPPHRRSRERYQRAEEQGRIYPQDEYAVIVAVGLVPAPVGVADALQVPVGAQVLRRRRVIHGPGGPREVSTSWFTDDSGQAAPRLLSPERIKEGTPRYLAAQTGRQISHARDRLASRLATLVELGELGLDPGAPTPVLVVEHVVFDGNDQPLEFTEAVYPPGRWAYEEEYRIP